MRKLKLLIAACALMGASATTWGQASYNPEYTSGVTVTAGENYFLYNIGAKMFLTDGMDWGTHATADHAGRLITFDGEGKYSIYTASASVNNDQEVKAGFMTTNGYCDTGTNDAQWQFETVNVDGYNNAYTIKNSDTQYLFFNKDDARVNVGNSTNDNYSYWLIIPKSVREEMGDYSFYLMNTDFNRPWERAVWAGSIKTNDKFTTGGLATNRCGEKYCVAIDVYQTISSSLPSGKYQVNVQAFYRQDNGDATQVAPYLYANDDKVTLKVFNAEDEGTAANMDGASTSFTEGKYVNTIETVVTDGKLTLGVKSENANNWLIFDNFSLTYLGADLTILKEGYDNAVKAATEFDKSKPMSTEAKTALTNAIDNYTSGVSETESALKEATEALNTAVNNATASVTAYASLKAAIDRVDEVVKTTNVYDKAYFDATKESYENGNFSTQEAADLGGGDRYKSLVTAVLCGNWYIGEKRATEPNSGFYQNTWSTEGDTDDSKMTTPFFEYWVGDGNALGATTLSTTIEELAPNATYSISMLVRVRQQNNNEKAEDDITLTLNNGEAISLVNGTQIKDVFFFQTVQATAVADADGKIALAINVKEGNHISWLAFKNLNYSNDVSGIAAEYEALQGQAETLLSSNDVVTGSEKTALETAKGASPSSLAEYTSAISTLQSAIDAFKAAIPNYEAFEAEKAIAQELGVSDIPSPTTGAEAAAAVNTLKEAEYVSVTTNYPNAVELGEWTATGGTASNKGQHWDGKAESTYLEQNGTNWSANSWDISFNQDVMLPAGTYIFKVAGRTANNDNVSMTLTVKKGDSVLGTVNDFPKGDTGKGIDTAGKTNFGEGTFANSNNGRGWQWRYVKFELSELTTVNIAVTAKATANKCWVGFCNPTVQAANSDAADLAQAIENLNTAKKAATLTKNTANIGSKPFQINESDNESLWSAYESAKNNVDNYELSSSSSTNEITSLVDALTKATQNYKNAELNAPAETQAYNLIFNCEGHTATGNALTLIPNPAQTQGLYGLRYQAPANVNLAQAFYFTHITGNKYKLHAIDTDGNERYITTQAEGYGTTWYEGIRTITDAEKAMEIEIRPNGEGLYILWNTGANKAIAHNGNNNPDLFTNNTANFQFVETTKPSIEVNTTEAGWGTIIVPFDVTSIPEGVKVYSCSGVNGNELTLKEEDAIEANKPYIIEGTWSETLTDDAQGTALTYTEGLLTGVYAEQEATPDTYVMQKGTKGVGFYKVANGSEPTISANHAYLTVSSSAREAYLLGEATAIKAIEALTSGKAEIYNAAGARQQRLQKGVNIIKSGDKTVKVMVK